MFEEPEGTCCIQTSRDPRMKFRSILMPAASDEVSSELISIAPGIAIAVGVGIAVGDDRSGVGVGVSVRVNNGGVSFWFGRPLVEGVGVAVGIAVGVRANVAITCRVRAVVIVQEGRISIGFRISGPLVEGVGVAVWVAVASVVARVAISLTVDGEARVGVRLSLLHWRSASKGRQKHYRLL